MISLLGYRRFDEYKVMGLAPYGDPRRYESLFQQFYTLLPDGDFEVLPDPAKLGLVASHGLLQHVRRKGEPFTQTHKDLAASIQDTLERLGLHVFRSFQQSTGARALAYAGGVAHNCTLNGKLLYSGLFDEVFVQPAAHDAGNALGAALAATIDEGGRVTPRRMTHLFLGTDIGDDRAIRSRLEDWDALVRFERPADIADRTADLLAGGAVVGWVQGRSEFGPRALGNRSILADARPAEFKHTINAMIKKREGYRPFAPSVVAERVQDFFDVPDGQTELPFMIFVVRVRDDMRETLGAVTHVDGTARVQTVRREANPAYHALLEAFGRRTGVPVLLNTSFNNDVEPIVDSVDDAIACFMTTGIHYLVVGDYLITRRHDEMDERAYFGLVPTMRPHQKLVRRSRAGNGATVDGHQATIESTASSYSVKPRIPISDEAFAVLLNGDGPSAIAARCDAAGIGAGDRRNAVVRELVTLWGRRAVTLLPPS